jgi:neutral trehalase
LNKRDFPRVHFYDQDFVEVYDRTWAWIADCWAFGGVGTPIEKFKYFQYNSQPVIDLLDQVFASFFLVYSNRIYAASSGLDTLYALQESDGAIRSSYNADTGKPIFPKDNPEGLGLPLFAWAEYNLYHKTANKKRVKEVMPSLQRHWAWMESTFKRENGLYDVPVSATGMENSPRAGAHYLSDFNAAMAMNALYLSALGDILNDKEASFQFKRSYFSLKTRINSLMWNASDGFYYDLDKDEKQVPTKTIGGYWPLLAEIPNEERSERLIAHLKDPSIFGTEHPIPHASRRPEGLRQAGHGIQGIGRPALHLHGHQGSREVQSVRAGTRLRDTPPLLRPRLDAPGRRGSRRGRREAFRESSPEQKPTVWEAYQPQNEGKAIWPEHPEWPRPQFLAYTGLSTIALMIENIVGLYISLPRKTVDWIIPNLEIMGIENLSPQAQSRDHPLQQVGQRLGDPYGEREALLLHDQRARQEEEDPAYPFRQVLDAHR